MCIKICLTICNAEILKFLQMRMILKTWHKAQTDGYPIPPDIEIEAALLRADSKQSVTAGCGLL